MDRDQFWRLIKKVDQTELASGYEDEALEALIEHLANLDKNEMEQFEDRLAKALFELDHKSLADSAGESGKSDDGFLYARCYVVARGKKFFDSVIEDASRMPQSTEQWCEPLLFAVTEAWAAKHDEEWNYIPNTNYETGSNKAGW
jgi:Protein of unknown function (DUF4240)